MIVYCRYDSAGIIVRITIGSMNSTVIMLLVLVSLSSIHAFKLTQHDMQQELGC